MKTNEFCIDDFLEPEHDRNGKSLPVYFRIPPSIALNVDILLYPDREKYLSTLEQRRRELLSSARWPAHPSRKGYRGR